MGKATRIRHEKHNIDDVFVLETKVYMIDDLENFPDGVKYSLILINKDSRQRVLMDNHHPKSHHYHLDDEEFEYDFQGIDKLVDDFKILAKEHLGVTI